MLLEKIEGTKPRLLDSTTIPELQMDGPEGDSICSFLIFSLILRAGKANMAALMKTNLLEVKS